MRKKLTDEERKARDAEYKRAWRQANPGYSAEWYQKNKEKVKERAKAWRDANPEKFAGFCKAWRENNSEHAKQLGVNWRKSNKSKAAASTAKYRAQKLRATPPWADQKAIEEFYKKAEGLGLHVDHIIPLRGRTVCGLHILSNLQLLTKSENSRKHNRLIEE